MKKYVKPELIYEHFELTQHIAACGWLMQPDGTALPNTDIWGEGYPEILYNIVGMCTVSEDQDEDACYHTAMAGTFNS